ncbi:MAG: putative membrane protein YfcA [Pseudorhodobacter sp.]|jgi:uncharacterized membrane protein YfcA
MTPGIALFMAMVLLGAAFTRGYSGFGLPTLVMTSAALVMDPLVLVPVILMVEISLSALLVPGVWRHINWRRAVTLFSGSLLGVPFGVYVLSNIGLDLARAILSGFVLVMCVLLSCGWSFAKPVGDAGHIGVGLVSGVANAAAVGGLPVAAFFAALGLPAVVFRATIIAYFLLLDIWSSGMFWYAGFITRDTWVALAMAMPLLLVGIWVGTWQFNRSAPKEFRRFAILLLAGLAGLGLLKSFL